MTLTLKLNARNDLHLPAELLRRFNLGEERMVKAELRGNALILIPVDIEPRYSTEELAGLDRLHEDEKKKGWIRLDTPTEMDRLIQ